VGAQQGCRKYIFQEGLFFSGGIFAQKKGASKNLQNAKGICLHVF